jgi:hypothetical protein
MKLKKSNISTAYQYDTEKYPTSGVYINTDEALNRNIILVNKEFGPSMVVFIGTAQDCLHIFEDEKPEIKEEKPEIKDNNHGQISEDFALKMLAVANGSVKQLDLNK